PRPRQPLAPSPFLTYANGWGRDGPPQVVWLPLPLEDAAPFCRLAAFRGARDEGPAALGALDRPELGSGPLRLLGRADLAGTQRIRHPRRRPAPRVRRVP